MSSFALDIWISAYREIAITSILTRWEIFVDFLPRRGAVIAA